MLALTVAVGFVSGVLSGMFGIGGGVVTTPALRLLLHTSALVAVGTPLPVIIPSALTGAITYARTNSADVRAGITLGVCGSAFAVAGAFLATRIGGSAVLVVTAALILYMALDMGLRVIRDSGSVNTAPAEGNQAVGSAHAAAGASALPAPGLRGLGLLGVVTGLYSGFLGLGGGFVMVPLLIRLFRFPAKRAIGTSLVAVTILAVPGSISHYLLGNIDLGAAGLLALGVVPGAFLGARITLGASERTVRVGLAIVLALVGVSLALGELGIR